MKVKSRCKNCMHSSVKNQSSEAFTAKNIIKNTEQTKIGITENTRKKCGVLRMTREEAIKYWEEFLSEIPDLLKKGFSKEEAEKQEEACKLAIKALQERPKGRWGIKHIPNHTVYKCPFCGRNELHKEPYCHCGADMRESEQE